ncbi:MAG: hypothetical protein WAV11_03600 [Minisyncoccia bacterium]
MENLATLFGGQAKVKLMRLFLFNTDDVFFLSQIVNRTKTAEKQIKADLLNLEKADMIRKKPVSHIIETKVRDKIKEVKKKEIGWFLNKDYAYLSAMRNLLVGSQLIKNEAILKRLSGAGKLKLVIVAGVFIQDWSSRVDMLIVGENLKTKTLENIIRDIEAEIGKELSYTYFDLADFKYRLSVCDKLVRDILDYPHQVVLDKTEEKKNERV